jgi:hypothetical protein
MAFDAGDGFEITFFTSASFSSESRINAVAYSESVDFDVAAITSQMVADGKWSLTVGARSFLTRGLLIPQRYGEHLFRLNCTGLQGVFLLDASQYSTDRSLLISTFLDPARPVTFTISGACDSAAAGRISVEWKQPGEASFVVIPGTVILSQTPTPAFARFGQLGGPPSGVMGVYRGGVTHSGPYITTLEPSLTFDWHDGAVGGFGSVKAFFVGYLSVPWPGPCQFEIRTGAVYASLYVGPISLIAGSGTNTAVLNFTAASTAFVIVGYYGVGKSYISVRWRCPWTNDIMVPIPTTHLAPPYFTRLCRYPDAPAARPSATLSESPTPALDPTTTPVVPTHTPTIGEGTATATQLVPSTTLSTTPTHSAPAVGTRPAVVPAVVLGGAEATAVEGSGVATAVVSAVSGPGAAVAANRALASVHALRCEVVGGGGVGGDASWVAEPEVTEYPLRFGLGAAGPLAMHRGAAVLNPALMAAAAAASALSWRAAGVPSLCRVTFFAASTLWFVLAPSTFRSATLVARFDEGGAWPAAAVVTACVLCGVACALHVAVGRSGAVLCSVRRADRRGSDSSSEADSTAPPTSAVERWTCPDRVWAVTSDLGEVSSSEVPYHLVLGRFHEDYDAVRFMTWEWAFSACSGVLSGLYPGTAGGCRALGVALAVLYLAYAVVCCRWRYFLVRSKLGAAVCVSVLQLCGMCAVVWQLVAVGGGATQHTATVVALCVVLSESVAALEQIVELGAWAVYRYGQALSGLGPSTSSGDETSTTPTSPSTEDAAAPLLLVAAEEAGSDAEEL